MDQDQTSPTGEVSKGAKIRNQYNQVPHLIQCFRESAFLAFLTL